MTTDLRLAKSKQLAAREAAIHADIAKGMADVDAGRVYAVVKSDQYFARLRGDPPPYTPPPGIHQRLDRIENALLAMEAFGVSHGGVGVAVKDILAGELRWCGGDPGYADKKPPRHRRSRPRTRSSRPRQGPPTCQHCGSDDIEHIARGICIARFGD